MNASTGRRLTVGLATAILTLASSSPTPAAAVVAADLQVEILTRVLAQDHSLESWSGLTLTIGLVFKSGNGSSRNLETLTAFRSLRGRRLRGVEIAVEQRAYRGAADLSAWISEKNVKLVYVGAELAAELEGIRSVCQEQKVVSVSPLRAFVQQGIALGVVVHRNKPKVVVNLPVTLALGMELDAGLLKLADVLR